MTKILTVLVAAMLIYAAASRADDIAATVVKFGLVGTWASDCTAGANPGSAGFRIIVAVPAVSAPIYTTVSSDAGVTTTVHSIILAAAPTGAVQLRLRLRITGGDRDGGPLPSPTTNTFEQVIEKVEGRGIRLVGIDNRFIQKCAN